MSRRTGSSHTGRSSTGAPLRPGRGDGAPRDAAASNAASGSASDGWVRHGTALPSWTDLEPSQNRRRRTSEGAFLENVSTLRFSLLILAVAAVFTLYVGHVHATTDLYNQLQQARTENQRLHLKRNRLQGEFGRQVGPSVIYERARELGLKGSVTYGPPITVEPVE
ncbi:hypothetical protein GGP91_002058 [Salinibacter ruber]|uniref:hypothetical protein n=1 Tax=Salinibacter ruber TaxID=146919 RepID=UPI0020730F3A|nr:hypothetical protein [Salinibacter ruber]MCS3829972.1 hypothetical protein [Salinibacter ruber]